MSGPELLIVLAAIVVGATIMGVLGFGFALVATPVMLLFVEPKSAVVTINAVTSITALLVLFQTRRHLKLRLAGGMSLGGLLTTRASLAFYFILFQTAALASYAMAGLITRDTVANVGLLLPGLLVGFGLATILAGRMNPQVFRYAATAVIILAGLVLLGREALRV